MKRIAFSIDITIQFGKSYKNRLNKKRVVLFFYLIPNVPRLAISWKNSNQLESKSFSSTLPSNIALIAIKCFADAKNEFLHQIPFEITKTCRVMDGFATKAKETLPVGSVINHP